MLDTRVDGLPTTLVSVAFKNEFGINKPNCDRHGDGEFRVYHLHNRDSVL